MDSSTKARAILGKPVFTLDELSVEDRWRIVEATLQICKPYLKYLKTSEFESINDLLNIKRKEYCRKTNKGLVSFFDKDINFKLRCIKIITIRSSESERKPTHLVKIRDRRVKHLLLSQKGIWIIWSYKMRVELTFSPEFQELLDVSETIEECKFKAINKEDFLNILSITPGLVYTIIDKLYLIAHRTVEEKRDRLRSIEEVRDELDAIKQRIQN